MPDSLTEHAGTTFHLSGPRAEAATLLYGSGEDDGAAIVRAALVRVLRLAETSPSPYALMREILTVGWLVPQETKAAYITGCAQLFRDNTEDPAPWRTFRAKLQALLLKAQTLLHAGDMLLQDWRIVDPQLKQLELFAAASPPVVPQMGRAAQEA
jgi:hypothetical protein